MTPRPAVDEDVAPAPDWRGAVSTSAAYTQPWVVAPGAPVQLHASLQGATVIDVVRYACLNAERADDGSPIGPPERIQTLGEGPLWTLPAQPQPLVPGVQVSACLSRPLGFARSALLLALRRDARGQGGAVLSALDAAGRGLALDIQTSADPRVAFLAVHVLGSAAAAAPVQLTLPCGDWLLLSLQLEQGAEGAQLCLRSAHCRAHLPAAVPVDWQCSVHAWPGAADVQFERLHIGTRPGGPGCADVRLDLLSLVPAPLARTLTPMDLLDSRDDGPARAAWESALVEGADVACLLRARQGKGQMLADLCGNAVITEVQRPYTGVRGLRWDGRHQGMGHAATHYSAVHLNADTLLDAHWPPARSWVVPADLASGAYAFRLRDTEGGCQYASFFVSAATRPRHRLAVLLPTFSYLAYANAPEDMRGPPVSAAPHAAEQLLDRLHPAFGRSIYERHADGQGVLYASTRRPLLSVGPGHRPWGLTADSWLLDWLETTGQAFDVVTDHDLHRLGVQALEPYAAVITGHHPEYWSTPMWDGLWTYLQGGGRLLYLGGNGLYWRTAVDEEADAIEVRRAEDGTRPTVAPPGEYHCSFSGEYGGLWRRLGRPPQVIVGVGMSAQGFEHAAHFRRCDDAGAPEVSFVFDGVDGDTFGHGGALGGASGWEIDRSDPDLGTPPGTWWLARSEGHAASMLRTKEELLSHVPPFADAKARSDITLAPIGHGDVFAVGSMTWFGSLHPRPGEGPTEVARITHNVIRRFLDPSPIARKPARGHR